MLKNTFKQKSKSDFSKTVNSKSAGSKLIFISNSKKSLTKYADLLDIYFKKLNINYSILHLPTSKKRITLLKSPHVNKKSKEHFELNTYKIQIILNSFYEIFLIKSAFVNRPKSIKLRIIT